MFSFSLSKAANRFDVDADADADADAAEAAHTAPKQPHRDEIANALRSDGGSDSPWIVENFTHRQINTYIMLWILTIMQTIYQVFEEVKSMLHEDMLSIYVDVALYLEYP